MNPINPAVRTDNIEYAIRDIVVVADRVRKTGKKILPLNIGDPCKFDFQTPPELIEVVAKAMRDNFNGYSPSSGIEEAVEAIRREAVEVKGIKAIQDIFITTGASEAIEIAMTSLINRGENILLPSPGYPLYSAIVPKLETVFNTYYLKEENGWQPDINDIESKINDKTRGIVIINPNNPTGSVCSKEILLQVIELAKKHNLVIFADEIYDKLILTDKKNISIASLTSDVPVITFNGLSKSFLAPGWRIGWAIVSGPRELLENYIEGAQRIVRARLSANHPLQYAIKPALEGVCSHLPETLQKLKTRGEITYKRLNSIKNISCVNPEGSFYAFPKINVPIPDKEWVIKLLEETGVLCVHGSGFGQREGTKHFRVVFLPQDDVLNQAYDKIEEFMNKHF
jgi:alanine-synthesizing transaminase